MRRVLVALVAVPMLGLMGVPAFLWAGGSAFGVSADHPLGTADRWATQLAEVGLVEIGRRRPEGPEPRVVQLRHDLAWRLDSLPADAAVLAYGGERSGARATIVLVRGLDDALDGVAASFDTPGEAEGNEAGVPTDPHVVEPVLATLWREVARSSPTFRVETRGRGRFARQYRAASFTSGQVRGEWLAEAAPRGSRRVRRAWVHLWVDWREPTSPGDG